MDIFTACNEGNLDRVKKLIKQGININQQNVNNDTALMIACLANHENIVFELLQVPGINVNITNDDNTTALIIASENNNTNNVEQLLLIPGINVNHENNDGETALSITRRHNNMVNLLNLINRGANVPEPDNLPDEFSIENINNFDNSSISLRDSLVGPPIILNKELAFERLKRNYRVIKNLNWTKIPYGKITYAEVKKGSNIPIKYSLYFNYIIQPEHYYIIIKEPVGGTPYLPGKLYDGLFEIQQIYHLTPNPILLINAITGNNLASVIELINQGVDVNALDVDPNDDLGDDVDEHPPTTALVFAAERNCIEIVDRLLQVPGINVNNKDNWNYTALIVASFNDNNQEIINRLLQVPNINVNSKDFTGRTALMIASTKDNQEIVTRLLQFPGINVNDIDSRGRTAAMFAFEKNNQEILDELVAHGAVNPGPPTNPINISACGICLKNKNYNLDGRSPWRINVLPCGHTFHRGCIQSIEALFPADNRRCPVCRALFVASSNVMLGGFNPFTFSVLESAIEINNPDLVSDILKMDNRRFNDFSDDTILYARNLLFKFYHAHTDAEIQYQQSNLRTKPNYADRLKSIISILEKYRNDRLQEGGFYNKLIKYQNKIII
jgi:ankyrin repeat protein